MRRRATVRICLVIQTRPAATGITAMRDARATKFHFGLSAFVDLCENGQFLDLQWRQGDSLLKPFVQRRAYRAGLQWARASSHIKIFGETVFRLSQQSNMSCINLRVYLLSFCKVLLPRQAYSAASYSCFTNSRRPPGAIASGELSVHSVGRFAFHSFMCGRVLRALAVSVMRP